MNAGTRENPPNGRRQAGVVLMILVGLAACAWAPAREPIHTAQHVDLDRFMGDWY